MRLGCQCYAINILTMEINNDNIQSELSLITMNVTFWALLLKISANAASELICFISTAVFCDNDVGRLNRYNKMKELFRVHAGLYPSNARKRGGGFMANRDVLLR